jgi:DNA-binding MarR family transcriptional regulator
MPTPHVKMYPPIDDLPPSLVLYILNYHQQQYIKRVLKKYDMTYLQFAALVILDRRPKSTSWSMKYLSVVLGVNAQTLAYGIYRTQGKRWFILPGADMFDERAARVNISNYGRSFIRELLAELQSQEHRLHKTMKSFSDMESQAEAYERFEHYEVPKARPAWYRHTHPRIKQS